MTRATTPRTRSPIKRVLPKKPVQAVAETPPPAPVPPVAPALTLRRVRDAFRLIGDVRALGSDPSQWRAHMVRGLMTLLEADMVVSSEISFHQSPGHRGSKTSPPPVMRDAGWGVRRDATVKGGLGEVWEIREDRAEYRPGDYHVLLGTNAAPESTLPDGQIAVRPRERLVVGEYSLLSQWPLPHAETVDQLVVYRFAPAGPFKKADARILRLFHGELGRLWRADAMREARDPAADLAPRLQQTLHLLAGGDSEKQVAYKLGISPHTVHNYVKALHQRFEVSSRGELLALVNQSDKGTSAFRPKLTGEIAG